MKTYDTALRACMCEDPAAAFRVTVDSLHSLPLHCAAWVEEDGTGVLGCHPEDAELPAELLEMAAHALRAEVYPLPALSHAAGRRYPAGEVLLLPVASSGTPLGGVFLVAPAGAFGAELEPWVQLGTSLGCVAARDRALRRAEAERELLRQRAEEMEAFDVLTLATNRTLDPDEVLPLVARFARTLLGADYVTVSTCEGGEVRARSAVGLREPPSAPGRDLLALRVVEAGRLLQVGADEELHPADPVCNRGEGMEAGIGVPLALFGETFGALVVGYRTPYRVTQRDRRLALALARHAAVAISNAQLHRAVEERSRELEAAYGRLRELTAAKERFYNAISHDLRTPVGAVKGYSELLLDGVAGELPDKARRYVGSTLRASQTLLSLVNDLLDFARIEAGKMELHPRACTLAEVVEDALASTRPQAEAKGLRVVVDLPQVPPLWTDPGRVCQVLVNLLGNAVKFTAEGEVALTALCLPPDGSGDAPAAGGLEVRVSDTGPGIAPEYRERIFAEFEQVPGSEGTGLGLPVSRSLARLLGGDLWVESEPGAGSTFVLRLPGCLAA
jgi:signal transduction histidine kinase